MRHITYPGYSYTDNPFSELLAEGSPTRPLILANIILSTPLFAAFAVGLWTSASPKRAAHITGAMLLGYTITGSAAQVFFPTLPRETLEAGEGTLRSALHPPVTLASILFLLLAVAFGATLLGRRFRYYSCGTIVTLVVFGVLSVQQGGEIEANQPTPWAELEQRINVYAFMF